MKIDWGIAYQGEITTTYHGSRPTHWIDKIGDGDTYFWNWGRMGSTERTSATSLEDAKAQCQADADKEASCP